MNRIRELRKQKGLTQVQMATIFKVSQGTLSYWESGSFEPDFDTLNQLADFFQTSTDYILGRVEQPVYYPDDGGRPLEGIYLRLARDAQEKQLPEEALARVYELFDEFKRLNDKT